MSNVLETVNNLSKAGFSRDEILSLIKISAPTQPTAQPVAPAPPQPVAPTQPVAPAPAQPVAPTAQPVAQSSTDNLINAFKNAGFSFEVPKQASVDDVLAALFEKNYFGSELKKEEK